jgi:hydroxymethylglutaryl-CoA reductase (NADPH)
MHTFFAESLAQAEQLRINKNLSKETKMFPASLLAKILVPGSLKNNATGFEFKLKNIIDSATLVGMGPLVVDDSNFTPDVLMLKVGQTEIRGDLLTRSNSLPIRVSNEALITATGAPLQPGPHKLTIQLLTREAGRFQFSVTEPLSQ